MFIDQPLAIEITAYYDTSGSLVQVDDIGLPDGVVAALYLKPLLTCGHYGEPIFDRSSQWDFPHEALICPEGCGERQMDVRLQYRLETDEF